MTDYLKQLLEERADALWEEERRLAAALAGVTGRSVLPGENFEEDAERRPNGHAPGERSETGESGPWEETEQAAGQGRIPERETLLLPLLAQTLELERAAKGAEKLTAAARTETPGTEKEMDPWAAGNDRRGSRKTGPWEETLGAPLPRMGEGPDGWTAGPMGTGAGGAEIQDDLGIEGLDRLFRRDSRRYDGGFFLY